LSILSTEATMRHVGVLLRGVGCHKLPVGVWGEAPTANGLARYCHDKLSVCLSVCNVGGLDGDHTRWNSAKKK